MLIHNSVKWRLYVARSWVKNWELDGEVGGRSCLIAVHLNTFEDFVQNKSQFIKELSNFLEVDFKGFRRYEGVFKNRSSDGDKKHFKLDEIKKNFNFTRILPKGLISFCWNLLAKIKQPKSIIASELSVSDRELVFRMLKTDLEAFERMTGINYFDR